MTVLALAVAGRGLVDPAEPVVPADDEALLRGRAAFETLRVYDGSPFRLAAHLDRLAASSEKIGLAPADAETFEQLAEQALGASAEPNAVLRLVWTAGGETRGPTALALVTTLPPQLEELRARGIRLVSLLGVRARVPWLLGGVKSTSYAVNIAAEREAKQRGADDAVFVDEDDIVLEGPVTNVWWRRGETLFTPSLDLGVLAGVTRGVLIDVALELGYSMEEGAFPVDEMRAADEAFTSSSVREVLPVVELDGSRIGDGSPGDAAIRLQQGLRNSTLSR